MSGIEPIPEDKRLTTYPIGRADLWDFYKRAQRSYWIPEEVSLSNDRQQYVERLTPGQRRFVDFVLAFFATSDKIVNINLAGRFKQDVSIIEADYFYEFQLAMENIHAEMYSLQIETIIPDVKERIRLLDGIKNIPVIAKMADWMYDTISSDAPFAVRLLRMACVEGIFFSGCFCAIYWLKNQGLMPGLGHANELIARDEGLHTQFALHLFTLVNEASQPSKGEVQRIFRDAVAIAKDFICDALPDNLSEMNAASMGQYIEYVADNLLALIGHDPLFGVKNPFLFMKQLNMENRTNFFERRPSEYSKPTNVDSSGWSISTEF